jgi:hypothetical protein
MKTLNCRSPRTVPRLAIMVVGLVCLLDLNVKADIPAAVNRPTPVSLAQVSQAKASQAQLSQAQPAAEPDIRDIRPPYHIPQGWLWIAWTAGGVALLALGYGTWRWRRHLGGRTKLPYQIALDRLEEARQLMQPEQARAFSFAVSEVVRDYIEECFDVQAAHRTTNEFFRDLATRSDSPLASYQPVLIDFLHHSDLAKFARWILSVPQMEAMLQSAGAFIVATGKPVAKSSAPAPASSGSPTTILNPQLS